MTPRLPALVVPVTRDPDDGRADLGGDRDRRRRLVDGDRLDARRRWSPAATAATSARRPIEGAGRAEREDGAARGEDGGQQRRRRAASRRRSARDGGRGRRWSGAGVGAGSYQRSGVTGGASSHERAQSARGSGAGVKRSAGGRRGARRARPRVGQAPSGRRRGGRPADRRGGARRRPARGRDRGRAGGDGVTLGSGRRDRRRRGGVRHAWCWQVP